MDMTHRRIVARAAWTAELSAMAALSAPLVLTNVAQNALTTSDVILMGWLGPQALAETRGARAKRSVRLELGLVLPRTVVEPAAQVRDNAFEVDPKRVFS